MPIWEAELFVSSSVGKISVTVEAATHEGARQQIDEIYGPPQQVLNIRQLTGGNHARNDQPGYMHDMNEISNKVERISEDISELLEIEQGRALEQSHKEYQEAYEELWKALNDEADNDGRDPISYEEMQLMHGDPFDDSIVGMRARKRVDGKVMIECIHCGQRLRIPDRRKGVVQCPSCEEDFFTDTTIEYLMACVKSLLPYNDGQELLMYLEDKYLTGCTPHTEVGKYSEYRIPPSAWN